ncbi:hypothetical protein M758_1G247100 [Ceratodon purpureus]|nr:hypothetical protein M758_1G247100 [Ceratodon purpureus]
MPAVELHTDSNGSYNGEIKSGKQTVNATWDHSTNIFEYTSSANPDMIPIPIQKLDATEHMSGPSRVTALDISKEIGIQDYPATSPNLLASFVRICVGESVTTNACATSQAFYVIHGRGRSQSGLGVVEWSTGDLFVLPSSSEEMPCTHFCLGDEEAGSGGAGLYWVSDAPLLSYLGVVPKVQKFKPAYFSRKLLLDNVENVRHEPGAKHRNRLGILLGNKLTPETKTLTHVLWSLLNVLPPGEVQRPHRHNSVALDLAVKAAPGTYTLMGKELDSHGWVKDPIRADWTTGSIFITPPGWWHSHHNDSQEEAWVLPIQDAGLYTHQRTLDIRFSDNEVASAEKAASQMRPGEEFHNSH